MKKYLFLMNLSLLNWFLASSISASPAQKGSLILPTIRCNSNNFNSLATIADNVTILVNLNDFPVLKPCQVIKNDETDCRNKLQNLKDTYPGIADGGHFSIVKGRQWVVTPVYTHQATDNLGNIFTLSWTVESPFPVDSTKPLLIQSDLWWDLWVKKAEDGSIGHGSGMISVRDLAEKETSLFSASNYYRGSKGEKVGFSLECLTEK